MEFLGTHTQGQDFVQTVQNPKTIPESWNPSIILSSNLWQEPPSDKWWAKSKGNHEYVHDCSCISTSCWCLAPRWNHHTCSEKSNRIKKNPKQKTQMKCHLCLWMHMIIIFFKCTVKTRKLCYTYLCSPKARSCKSCLRRGLSLVFASILGI